MNKLLTNVLKIASPIVLGGFILYWIYRDFDFSRIREVLLNATNWGWMAFSLVFLLLARPGRGRGAEDA